jgi:hypothetical protein
MVINEIICCCASDTQWRWVAIFEWLTVRQNLEWELFQSFRSQCLWSTCIGIYAWKLTVSYWRFYEKIKIVYRKIYTTILVLNNNRCLCTWFRSEEISTIKLKRLNCKGIFKWWLCRGMINQTLETNIFDVSWNIWFWSSDCPWISWIWNSDNLGVISEWISTSIPICTSKVATWNEFVGKQVSIWKTDSRSSW